MRRVGQSSGPKAPEKRGQKIVKSHHIQKLDDVWSPAQVLQNLDLALNLSLFDRLENLDHTPEGEMNNKKTGLS